MNFLGYAYWFMSIMTSQLRDHYIFLDQDIYATSVVAKYLVTDTTKENSKLHKTTLSHDMIFTKKMLIPVIKKCKYCLENTKLTTDLVWYH